MKNFDNENLRIAKLNSFEILDTPPDGTFDQIVEYIALILNVPISLVTLVDSDRVWFKSAFGLEAKQLSLKQGEGLCSSAILSEEFYEIKDALKDPRTLNNILVNSAFGLRFYAAYPLRTTDGCNLGTLCVIDKKPREITEEQQNILKTFSQIIVEQLELRLMARMAIKAKMNSDYMLIHELKSDICYIPKIIEIIKEKREDPNEVEVLLDMITQSSTKAVKYLDKFIQQPDIYDFSAKEDIAEFDFSNILNNCAEINKSILRSKNQTLILNIEKNINIKGNGKLLTEMINNLITNAIKFSPKNTKIEITTNHDNQNYYITVKDEGQGMDVEDIQNAFKRFSKLSAQPTNNENSTGLGLWVVKEIVEFHKGHIFVQSKGKGQGCTFKISLPLSPIQN